MNWRRLVLAVAIVGLAGCSLNRDRLTDPLDRVVVPPLDGAGEGPTADSTEAVAKVRSYVVLLPDDEGRVGEIEVTVGGESVVLDRANQAVDFSDLSQTFEVDATSEEVFERPLSAEPPPAVRFLVSFDLGSAEPSEEEVERIRGIVDPVRDWAAPEVAIEGHADRSGADTYNQDLSALRAETVRQLLERLGIEPIALDVRAFGETRPVVVTADGVPEARNRRVEVRIR